MSENKRRHEEKYSPGDDVAAGDVAEILSENSGKLVSASNSSAILDRKGVQPYKKIGRMNVYHYEDVKDIKVNGRVGRPTVSSDGVPLSDAEKMRRSRARRAAVGSGSSAGPGAGRGRRGRVAAASDDPGNQGDEKPDGLVLCWD